MKRVLVAASVVAVALALTLEAPGFGSSRTAVPAKAAARRPAPRLERVAVLVLENRSWNQIIGNRRAPYLNALASQGAVADHYYALTHPSLPNYVAMTTGGHRAINGDCSTCRSRGRSLAGQLATAKISWRAYFESMGNPLATRYSSGSAYNPHYNPFAYTQALRAPNLVANVTAFAALRHDLAAQSLPRFAWIAPNVWHDGHNGTLAAVDRFAKQLVPQIVAALGPRGVLFITWDEGRDADTQGAHGRGGGHIPLIAVGPAARAGAHVATPSNHYALLRTIESAFGLPALGHARDATVPVLSGLLNNG